MTCTSVGLVEACDTLPLEASVDMAQEKAIGVRVLREVEELAVSKLDHAQQTQGSASCEAAKQFLHEAPYEQVCIPPARPPQPILFSPRLPPACVAALNPADLQADFSLACEVL